MYFMVHKNFEVEDEYNTGFSLSELFTLYSAGIVTARDSFTIQENKEDLIKIIHDFVKLKPEEARDKYKLGKDVRDWKVDLAQADLRSTNLSEDNICKISYRLFDDRYTYYTGKSKGFHCMPRGGVMQHFISEENIGLTLCKQFKTGDNYYHCFICNKIIESSYVSNRTSEITSVFPLYFIPGKNSLDKEHQPNFNESIVNQIAKNLVLLFTNKKEETKNTFSPIDILDYIYAVLHSTSYRAKYKEFLKIDFPRIPYPGHKEAFWKCARLGSELRTIHLLKNPVVENYITSYPVDGKNIVEKPQYKNGKVFINKEQYFDNLPELAWNFFIGGYQPAQKWLRDRKGMKLDFDDIFHYQKIIVALIETDRIMKEIDEVISL